MEHIENGIAYQLHDDGTATAARLVENISILRFPETVNDHLVCGVADNFAENSKEYQNVEELWLPKTACNIGAYAFAGFQKLRKVVCEATPTTLGKFAFHDCAVLEEVIGQEFKIGEHCFYKCASLKKCDGVINSIDLHAFEDCISLETVEFVDGIKIPRGVFYNCTNTPHLHFNGSADMNEHWLPRVYLHYPEGYKHKELGQSFHPGAMLFINTPEMLEEKTSGPEYFLLDFYARFF